MRALLLIGLVAATLACGRTEAQIPSPASGPSSPEVVVADPAGGRLFVADVTRKVVLASTRPLTGRSFRMARSWSGK